MSIKLKLTGGLGNQMFQFAAGYSIAKRKSVDLNLDLSWYNRRNIHNGFELKNVFDIYKKVNFLNNPFSFKQFISKIDFTYKIYDEPHFHYTQEILNVPNHCFLRGYWQSEEYFEQFTDEIKKIFNFDVDLNDENIRLVDDIFDNKSVSLHIRRGDFLLKRNVNHNVDLTSYYSNAINEVSRNFDKPKFFIFTDDPDWVSKNFSTNSNFKVVDKNTNAHSFLDMYLMSLCNANIVANSSFSWWGAWLNKNKDKVIFAPKKWFNDKSIKTNNLFPDTWNII